MGERGRQAGRRVATELHFLLHLQIAMAHATTPDAAHSSMQPFGTAIPHPLRTLPVLVPVPVPAAAAPASLEPAPCSSAARRRTMPMFSSRRRAAWRSNSAVSRSSSPACDVAPTKVKRVCGRRWGGRRSVGVRRAAGAVGGGAWAAGTVGGRCQAGAMQQVGRDAGPAGTGGVLPHYAQAHLVLEALQLLGTGW